MAATEWDDALVHSISTVPISAAEDQRHRVRVYLLSMGIRTVSFSLAILFAVVLDVPWAAWLFAIASVVLPYPAVVLANNRDRHVTAPVVINPRRELTDHPTTAPQPPNPHDDLSASDESSRITINAAGAPVTPATNSSTGSGHNHEHAQRPGHEVQPSVRRGGWASG